VASAQFSKLDDASAQLASRLKPLKPSLVAVADFASPDGSASAQAHYFSWYLSEFLQEHGKNIYALPTTNLLTKTWPMSWALPQLL
jgi:hypothetical protein